MFSRPRNGNSCQIQLNKPRTWWGLDPTDLERLEAGQEKSVSLVKRYARSLGASVALRAEGGPKVITFYNHAGGAGKTTLTRDMGYTLSQAGFKTLLIDLDPQHSLTSSLGLGVTEAISLNQTVFRALAHNRFSDDYPALHAHGLDVIPSCLELDRLHAYISANAADTPQFKLRVLCEMLDRYDFILIDCPSSMSGISSSAVLAADYLVVPVTPDPKGLAGAHSVVGFHRRLSGYAPRVQLALFVPTLVDKRFAVQKEGLKKTFEYLEKHAPVAPALMCRKSLYDGAWNAQMPSKKFNPSHAGVKELDAVADRLLTLIGVNAHVLV